MCGLCGALGEVDWTDRSASPALSGPEAVSLQAERRRLADLANRMLAAEGLRLSAWQANGFILRNRTGKQEVLASVLQVWGAAERMLGRPLDPLDPQTIEAARRS